jgi:hypothetical protein
MLRKPKTKAPSPTRHTPPKKAKPPRVSVSIPADLLEQSGDYLPPLPKPGTVQAATRSAHGVEGPTPCHTCGGPCERIEGRHGPWRRHIKCERISQPWQRVRAAAEHYSLPVTDDEARAAAIIVPTYAEGHAGATYSDAEHVSRPWAHVRLPEIVRGLMLGRQRLAEAAAPMPCDLGRCGWCGTEKSVRWSDYGHVRHDGTSAPLCDACGPVFDRRGQSAKFWDDQRGGIAEAMTGAPPNMGEEFPDALRAHAEVGGGDGTAWSHLPCDAVEAFRWARWGRSNGRYAPPEHKAEALARAGARAAERAARQAAHATVDPFGFNGAQEGESDG